jgi:hypothetical protein
MRKGKEPEPDPNTDLGLGLYGYFDHALFSPFEFGF